MATIIPVPAPATIEVITLKDVKAPISNGGTFTAGSFQTRTLNTLENPQSVTWVSLLANQFTLQPGTYRIWGAAPAYRVDRHQATLYNITDSVVQIIGSSALANSGSLAETNSIIVGVVVLASAKVFEFQHRCAATKSGDGFGLSAFFGIDDVYATVEITKLA